MKHTYKVNGATCSSCAEKVSKTVKKIPAIEKVEAAGKDRITVHMKNHVELSTMNAALNNEYNGKYVLEMSPDNKTGQKPKSIKTYWPLILVLMYVLLGTLFGMHLANDWTAMMAMRMFMGLFFLGFSFFKLLDVPGFAMSYASYDIVAAKFFKWGYFYPFIELAFGIFYLLGWQLLWLNIVVAVVMSVSLIGVAKSVLNKKEIQCACLGTGFNLPMSTVTIVEDAGMVIMAIWMIFNLLNI